MLKNIRSFYITNRFFQLLIGLIGCFIVSFIIDGFIWVPKALFILLTATLLADIILLYGTRRALQGRRFTPDKFSNGDENEVRVFLESRYPFTITLTILDEIPHQFQLRQLRFPMVLRKGASKTLKYYLRPVKRGAYSFGAVNVFVQSPLGLGRRRFRFSADTVVPVYPSFIQMRKYELMAISNRLTEAGIKKIRRIGHNMEFELIKEYVPGDDYRTINWRATARRDQLMVNHFQDERSQQVYSLIDKGRVMQMPFHGLSLLDYAINASLVISNIAIKKADKAGLITFQHTVSTTVAASKRNSQMMQIMEVLYNQKTAYRESDFSLLYNHVRRKISQRSLLLLFTNFETIQGLHRQLNYIKSLSRQHLVVVIFFENTEISQLIQAPAHSLREIYHKTIAEKFYHEKRLIVKELLKYGIQALLTSPERLTVDTINKYLELKARGMI